MYFGFGNKSAPLTSKSHALKDNNAPTTTEEASVVLDKKEWEEVKDTPQKEVGEKKKVGSRKRSSRRKKKTRK